MIPNDRRMNISEEAVEAALVVSLRQLGLERKTLPEGLLEARKASITEILEAATPSLMAQGDGGRDELRDVIQSNLHRIDGFQVWTFQAPVDLADALLVAGYKKNSAGAGE